MYCLDKTSLFSCPALISGGLTAIFIAYFLNCIWVQVFLWKTVVNMPINNRVFFIVYFDFKKTVKHSELYFEGPDKRISKNIFPVTLKLTLPT